MQAAADSKPTAMCSVIGLKADKVEELCQAATEAAGEGESVQIANFLCNGNYAVSGTVKAIEELEARMTVRLAVAGAFHTKYMDSAVGKLQEVLSQAEIKAPRIPVFSNVDAKPHSDPEVIKSILAMQVTSPVQWETTLGGLLEGGLETSYELGPGKVVAGIMKRIDRKHGGNDEHVADSLQVSPGECAEECVRREGCRFWTYDPSGMYGHTMCWTWTGDGPEKVREQRGWISGNASCTEDYSDGDGETAVHWSASEPG